MVVAELAAFVKLVAEVMEQEVGELEAEQGHASRLRDARRYSRRSKRGQAGWAGTGVVGYAYAYSYCPLCCKLAAYAPGSHCDLDWLEAT